MKLSGRSANSKSFSAPTVLKRDTPFFGATVGAWDAAITGNMQQKLDRMKQQAATVPMRDVKEAKSFDVASLMSKRVVNGK